MYRDTKTGEHLTKITDWRIVNGEAHAEFMAASGAIFTMVKIDVVKV